MHACVVGGLGGGGLRTLQHGQLTAKVHRRCLAYRLARWTS